ncbi:Peptidyl-prolyl cis-trans isomerase A precursor [Pseudobythopirellula maris]|uniref:Peptidyl-prolyl cis-trans isomerase n=1 Tax=Pseudobythopirellula maris TaxID=2527991 RepID=A0A5C5ZG79_9BACT|nr:peptidylprolyl isomerase [Pseudobythopirellula maris]TWT86148.1 Peptidyl-prolyl cis-trans isomerase A precursor [Pseudobythopirellula maris]
MNFNARLTALAALASLLTLASDASAVIVRFDTVLGDIDVRLYQGATPQTTQNFINYADDGDWDGSFIHRSVPGFVIQGGGFSFSDQGGVSDVASDPAVMNEPGISNLRGTIAMAKVGGDPNSATSEWFFNLDDNSANLDFQNGGFTAFGRVLGDGMDVVDSIAALPRVNAGAPFDNLPVIDFEQPNVNLDELVVVNSVSVLNFADGDYDFDGDVDLNDRQVWLTSFGSTTLAEADGNGNGVVDAADFTIWRDSYNASSVSLSIPEPTGFVLTTAAVLLAGLRRPVSKSRRARRS